MATSAVQGEVREITNVLPSIKHTTEGKFFHQRLSYVNGGVTFNYPAGLFSSEPIVHVTLSLQNLAYSVTSIMTACITSSTSSSVTIRINVGTIAGGILEAASNDVYVNVLAVL